MPIVKEIFESKNNLNHLYPEYGIKSFDLERKHLFYGRIDKRGNAVYLDAQTGLEQIYTGEESITEFAVDFVSDAFDDLRAIMINAHNNNVIERESPYNGFLSVRKAWSMGGDLEASYFAHINSIYANFTQKHLLKNRRYEKINNFRDFVQEFLNYSVKIASNFPITKTGYILSKHCSPFVSGLMLEIATEQHGTQNNKNVVNYLNDPNFKFFAKEAAKFGFMVDRNAPWRLVFNIASGELAEDLRGGKKYMDRYGVSFDNIFDYYYVRAHLQEVDNLKKYFLALYNSFYTQYSTYESEQVCLGSKAFTRKKMTTGTPAPTSFLLPNIKFVRKDREPPPELLELDNNEYWIKLVLKLRLHEDSVKHTNAEHLGFIKKSISLNRDFGMPASLNYINDLTRGLHGPKFIRKGKYWLGYEGVDYENRKSNAVQDINNPDASSLPLIGTKNIR